MLPEQECEADGEAAWEEVVYSPALIQQHHVIQATEQKEERARSLPREELIAAVHPCMTRQRAASLAAQRTVHTGPVQRTSQARNSKESDHEDSSSEEGNTGAEESSSNEQQSSSNEEESSSDEESNEGSSNQEGGNDSDQYLELGQT